MKAQPRQVQDAILHVTTLLVHGQYEELARMSGGERLSADEIEQAVVEYGRKLVLTPRLLDDADVVITPKSTPPRWSVNIPLWTREEGRSDLTLSLTVIAADSPPGYVVEIDDIHVL
ncbi:MAG: hypothetical protein IPK74_28695 [Deltaproteobacteria bacterium]|nr:hypothetical protein [Deltaproteobacteria bacterium]